MPTSGWKYKGKMITDGAEWPSAEMLDALSMVAPGTEFAEGLVRIRSANNGAIIVFGSSDDLMTIVNGGFKVDCKFSAPALFELAKMDGACVVKEDMSRILFANVHLMPDYNIQTRESGTRHRTSERVAKQFGGVVVAISKTLKRITLYAGSERHVLEEMRMIMRKTTQALQTLEKYRTRLDNILASLTALEIENIATLMDVALVLQRAEMVRRIAGEVDFYIIELGSEGRLARMQLGELMFNVDEEMTDVIKDYMVKRKNVQAENVIERIEALHSEELLDLTNIAKALGYGTGKEDLDKVLSPRGRRILKKIPRIPNTIIDNLIEAFGDLHYMKEATMKKLEDVEGIGHTRAKALKDGLKKAQEQTLFDRNSR